MEDLALFIVWVLMFISIRASGKLLADWIRMRSAVSFVQESYRRLGELPSEGDFDRDPRAPIFLHLVAAYQEPEIAETVKALLASRYARTKLRVVVITKEEEGRAPHPNMKVDTAELVHRLKGALPPSQREQVHVLTMPGPGRKPHQLNWALRPEMLREILGSDADPACVFVGVSDADSRPHPDTFRWIAHRELTEQGMCAYQGVTLSLANYASLDRLGKVSAIQQSSIFLRISIPRLLSELARMRFLTRLYARFPGAGSSLRPVLDALLRRSHILLGHNQFVRLDTLQMVGGFPVTGATEDSTLGYALGLHGVPIQPMPMVELCELPETQEKVIQQNARWYKGVLDDTVHLWRAWRKEPSPFNLVQLVRHAGTKAVEWPVAALLYPVAGLLCGQLWRFYPEAGTLFVFSLALPTLSLFLSIWVGGVSTHAALQDLLPCFPHAVDLRRKGFTERFLGTFRCHRYWLLASRGAWRVLGSLLRTGHYEPRKTDRLIRPAMTPAPSAARHHLSSPWVESRPRPLLPDPQPRVHLLPPSAIPAPQRVSGSAAAVQLAGRTVQKS
jgi:cellulose synthase/poly-beta-1,6-N-acetylglucosamine synthase-like glycosyltransferase